jgi:hypothetical protein
MEGAMTQPLEPLVLDFVEWVATAPRPYAEAMDAWRTSCPRLTVFEDAVDRGLVSRKTAQGRTTIVATPRGLTFLREHGRA